MTEDVWTRLSRHRRRWEKNQADLSELRQERFELILEASKAGPLTLVAQTLGISRERVSAIVRTHEEVRDGNEEKVG